MGRATQYLAIITIGIPIIIIITLRSITTHLYDLAPEYCETASPWRCCIV